MAKPIPAPRAVVYRLFSNPVLWVFLITLAVLAIHPIPECVDCEFSHPWGRDDLTYHHASAILDVWFVVASLTAGFFSVRRYWLVPVSITLAHVITQPLGGVALWSLWSNEGPVLVLVGFAAGAVGLTVGATIRFFADRLVKATP